jgi:hypothetical protein
MDREINSAPTHDLPTHLGVSQPLLRWGLLRLDVMALAKLGLVAVAAYCVWQLHGPPPELRLAGTALIGLIALAFSLIQPADQPLETWLLPVLVYALRPRTFVWRSRAPGHPWAAVSWPETRMEGGWYRLAEIHVSWVANPQEREP